MFQISLRRSTRTLVVVAIAFSLMIGTLTTPALAEGGREGEGLEDVRATVLDIIEGKIGSLHERQEAATTDEAWLIYDEALGALDHLFGMAAEEDSVDALWELKAEAKAIYNEAVAEAESAGKSDEQVFEEERSETIGMLEGKLGHFRELRDGTDNGDARAVYNEAISKLEALLAEARESESIDRLEAIRGQAHEIYEVYTHRGEEARDPEDEVDEKTPEQDEVDEKTPEQKAKEALERARRKTLKLIEHKVSIFKHAAEAARRPAVAEIFRAAAEAVGALADDARAARSIRQLEEINGEVEAIVKRTRAAVGEYRDDVDQDASDHLMAYLDRLSDRVLHLLDANESTAEFSPDTWADVVSAADKLLATIASLEEVASSGDGLDQRMGDLKEALHHFHKAFMMHIIAVTDGPRREAGMHIPG